jgi:hypothetical protein
MLTSEMGSNMRRREFIITLCGAAACHSLGVRSSPTTQVDTINVDLLASTFRLATKTAA